MKQPSKQSQTSNLHPLRRLKQNLLLRFRSLKTYLSQPKQLPNHLVWESREDSQVRWDTPKLEGTASTNPASTVVLEILSPGVYFQWNPESVEPPFGHTTTLALSPESGRTGTSRSVTRTIKADNTDFPEAPLEDFDEHSTNTASHSVGTRWLGRTKDLL